LQNFQFPWRFLGVTVFTTAVLGAYVTEVIPKKLDTYFVVFSIVLIVFISSFYWSAKGYDNRKDSYYTSVWDSTTDTGESAPVWSVRFMEKRPKAQMEIVDGEGSIKNIERKSTYHKQGLTCFGEHSLLPGLGNKCKRKTIKSSVSKY
jgi:hypothetical protein